MAAEAGLCQLLPEQQQNGSTSNNLGLSGTLLERNNLSWSVQEGYTSQGKRRAVASTQTGGRPTLNYRRHSHDKYSHRLNYALRVWSAGA